jgi:hypothetical protein
VAAAQGARGEGGGALQVSVQTSVEARGVCTSKGTQVAWLGWWRLCRGAGGVGGGQEAEWGAAAELTRQG